MLETESYSYGFEGWSDSQISRKRGKLVHNSGYIEEVCGVKAQVGNNGVECVRAHAHFIISDFERHSREIFLLRILSISWMWGEE